MPLSSRHVRYAPKSAKFILVAQSDNLPKGRRLVATAPVTMNDGGDAGDFTIAVNGATGSDRGVVKLAGQLGGAADAPDVRGVRVNPSTTPLLLTLGAVADGQVLGRSGTSLVGVSALSSGGGALTGPLAMGTNKVTGIGNGVDPQDAATYGQLTSMINGLDWQASVLDKLDGPPGSFSPGDRFLVGTGTGDWATHGNHIAVRLASSWQFLVPNNGWTVHVDNGGRDTTFDGTVWVDMGASIDHSALLSLTSGNPHTQYQLASQREASGGYAGLDTDLLPIRPTRGVRVGSDPSTPGPGEVWIVGNDLKFQNNAGSPATELVERQARRNQNDGYAGLDNNGRVEANQAPAKAVYVTGGAQAIAPADIGAPATSRSVATGVGLGGGGNLSADRTLSIVAFTGVVSRDIDPGSQNYPYLDPPTVHLVIDAGAGGTLMPAGLRLPATVDGGLRTECVFTLDDASTVIVSNASSSNPLDMVSQDLAFALAGDLNSAAARNGRSVQKVELRTRNNTGADINSVDIGVFRFRGWAAPRGGGGAL